jgi:SAM-dependent methyltransferase
MKQILHTFFDKRPELKELVARAVRRGQLFLTAGSASKARLVSYDHELFRCALRDNANKNGRELHSLMHLKLVLDALRLVGCDPGGEILEIGAGRAGLPVALLACGFDRVHVNEISNVVNRFEVAHVESLYVLASLMGVCRRRLEDIVVPLDSRHCAIRPDMIRTHPFTDASALDIPPRTLTAVVSFTVLEHLRNPEEVFRHLRTCLAPGGWMCHVVDMRDHEDFEDPLHFLTLSSQRYRNRTGDWCNRLRHSDFVELFTRTGFEVLSTGVTNFNELDDRKSTDFWKMLNVGLDSVYRDKLTENESWVTDEFISRIHPDYRRYHRSELSILQAKYVLRGRD